VIARSDHPGTVHVVACPATGVAGVTDRGRLSPALLLAHALANGLTPPGPVVVVGPTGAADTARRCGLDPTATLAPPLGNPRMGRPGLRRIAGGADRVVCWSDEIAPLVARTGEQVRLVSTLPDACPEPPRRFSAITVLTEHDAGRWRERGASQVTVAPWADRLREGPPGGAGGLGGAGGAGQAGAALRARAGVDERTLVLTALHDTPRQTDARGLAFLLSVLHTTGYPVCGVIPSIAANAPSAARHVRSLASRYRLLVCDGPVTDLLSGVDVAVMPEQPDTGSGQVLDAFAASHGCRVVRLSHRGRAGLKSTPGVAAPILEALDAIRGERRPGHPARPAEPVHV
jgi:hypothetical protein